MRRRTIAAAVGATLAVLTTVLGTSTAQAEDATTCPRPGCSLRASGSTRRRRRSTSAPRTATARFAAARSATSGSRCGRGRRRGTTAAVSTSTPRAGCTLLGDRVPRCASSLATGRCSPSCRPARRAGGTGILAAVVGVLPDHHRPTGLSRVTRLLASRLPPVVLQALCVVPGPVRACPARPTHGRRPRRAVRGGDRHTHRRRDRQNAGPGDPHNDPCPPSPRRTKSHRHRSTAQLSLVRLALAHHHQVDARLQASLLAVPTNRPHVDTQVATCESRLRDERRGQVGQLHRPKTRGPRAFGGASDTARPSADAATPALGSTSRRTRRAVPNPAPGRSNRRGSFAPRSA